MSKNFNIVLSSESSDSDSEDSESEYMPTPNNTSAPKNSSSNEYESDSEYDSESAHASKNSNCENEEQKSEIFNRKAITEAASTSKSAIPIATAESVSSSSEEDDYQSQPVAQVSKKTTQLKKKEIIEEKKEKSNRKVNIANLPPVSVVSVSGSDTGNTSEELEEQPPILPHREKTKKAVKFTQKKPIVEASNKNVKFSVARKVVGNTAVQFKGTSVSSASKAKIPAAKKERKMGDIEDIYSKHGLTTKDMLMKSLNEIKMANGITRPAIVKYMTDSLEATENQLKLVTKNIKAGIEEGWISLVNGTGANGRFKLSPGIKEKLKKQKKKFEESHPEEAEKKATKTVVKSKKAEPAAAKKELPAAEKKKPVTAMKRKAKEDETAAPATKKKAVVASTATKGKAGARKAPKTAAA